MGDPFPQHPHISLYLHIIPLPSDFTLAVASDDDINIENDKPLCKPKLNNTKIYHFIASRLSFFSFDAFSI